MALPSWVSRLAAIGRLVWACRRLTAAHVETLGRVVPILSSPAYRMARIAVEQTATHPAMRDHHAWHDIARIAKAWGWSDALYRRMSANETTERLTRVVGSAPSARVRELAVELAYHDYRTTHGKAPHAEACDEGDLPGVSHVVHRTPTAWFSGVQ